MALRSSQIGIPTIETLGAIHSTEDRLNVQDLVEDLDVV